MVAVRSGQGRLTRERRRERWHRDVASFIPEHAGRAAVETVGSRDPSGPMAEDLRAVNERLLLSGLREQAARADAERLAAEHMAVLAQIADGVVIADPAASVTFVNDAARRLDARLHLGTSLKVYAASGHCRMLDGRPYPLAAIPVIRALGGETVVGAQLRILRDDGTEVTVRTSGAPLTLADGRRLGAVWTLQEISAEHALAHEPLLPDFVAGTLAINFHHPRVTLRGELVKLTALEYKLLCQLAANAGRVLPTQVLLARVWASEYEATRDCLKVYISRLRAKIEPSDEAPHIETVRGLGYRFVRPPLPGTRQAAHTGGRPSA